LPRRHWWKKLVGAIKGRLAGKKKLRTNARENCGRFTVFNDWLKLFFLVAAAIWGPRVGRRIRTSATLKLLFELKMGFW